MARQVRLLHNWPRGRRRVWSFNQEWSSKPTTTWEELQARFQLYPESEFFGDLKLSNPAIEGLDPWSPDLTEEQKRMILEECKINPAYFFAIVVRAPSGKTS